VEKRTREGTTKGLLSKMWKEGQENGKKGTPSFADGQILASNIPRSSLNTTGMLVR